jgi:soluble lytic murein transglycosylase-like protein
MAGREKGEDGVAMRWFITMAGLVVAAGMLAPAAMADIYVYRDENGVTNATNIMPPARYKIDKVFRDSGRTKVAKVTPQAPGSPYIKTARGTINTLPLADPPTSAAVHAIMAEAATALKLDKALVRAIIQTESAFNVHATSPKGARGLMQLMPETAARYGVRDIFDPEQNIWGGTRYMRDLLEKFNQDLPLAIAAYNAGENAVVRYGGIPPYPETRNYVQRVMALHQQYGG